MTASPSQTHVLVAGAGPVGMTAALLLARGGVQVTVLEAGESLAGESRASTFHPPSLEMLDELGVLEPLMEQRHRVDRLPVPRPSYRPDRRPRPGRAVRGHPLPVPGPGRAVQADPGDPRGPRRHGQRDGPLRPARGRRPRPTASSATVTTEAGDTFTADWVLGADGANSQVRQTAGFSFEGMTYPERFLVASTTEDLESILPGISAVNYVFDPTEWLVLLRTPEHWRILFPTDPEHPGRGRERPGPGAGAAARRRRPRPGLGRPAHHALPRAPAGRRHVPQGPAAADGRRRAHQQPARRDGHEQRHPRRVRRDQGAARADPGRRHRGAAGRGVRRPAARSRCPTSRRSPTTTGRSCARTTPRRSRPTTTSCASWPPTASGCASTCSTPR